jgi:hypothetical protein
MAAWVPLLQTLSWVGLIVFALLFLRVPVQRTAAAFARRVEGDGDVELTLGSVFSAKLGQLDSLTPVAPGPPDSAAAGDPPSWTDERETIARSTRSLHLVHVIKPSAERGPGWFEIFAFLVGHRRQKDGHPPDLSDVVRAEFFLGRHWGNRIIEAEIRPGRPIGLATSAYGPTLCLCRVTFADGGTAVLSRYLDFEMSGVFTADPTSRV